MNMFCMLSGKEKLSYFKIHNQYEFLDLYEYPQGHKRIREEGQYGNH